jgi:hypothetical protein
VPIPQSATKPVPPESLGLAGNCLVCGAVVWKDPQGIDSSRAAVNFVGILALNRPAQSGFSHSEANWRKPSRFQGSRSGPGDSKHRQVSKTPVPDSNFPDEPKTELLSSEGVL